MENPGDDLSARIYLPVMKQILTERKNPTLIF